MRRGRTLPRAFYRRSCLEVAPDLLNKVLVHWGSAARIVEVEAYAGEADPGSHAFRGRTPRTAVMFGPPGHLYVYFTYGMHWCANTVCGAAGEAAAVLLRAGAPMTGLEEMRLNRRAARTDRDLCRGPARLCQALAITGEHNGLDLTRPGSGVRIVDDGVTPPPAPGVSTRIGLGAGAELPWRWFVPGESHLSRPAGARV